MELGFIFKTPICDSSFYQSSVLASTAPDVSASTLFTPRGGGFVHNSLARWVLEKQDYCRRTGLPHWSVRSLFLCWKIRCFHMVSAHSSCSCLWERDRVFECAFFSGVIVCHGVYHTPHHCQIRGLIAGGKGECDPSLQDSLLNKIYRTPQGFFQKCPLLVPALFMRPMKENPTQAMGFKNTGLIQTKLLVLWVKKQSHINKFLVST